jgi:DNA-binding GntR family transcriptional regulator
MKIDPIKRKTWGPQKKASTLRTQNDSLVIEHDNLDDKIYQRLKTMITESQLEPGKRILQEQLARDMGVSRTPLVNALKRLAQEGLLEWLPRRAIYVKRFTPREVAQIFEVREGLEPMAARMAARRIDPGEVDELEEMFKEFTEDPTPAAVRRYLQADRYFHWRLVELAENPYLAAAMESVNMMISAYQVGIPRSLAESLPEHRAILHALRKQDPEASEQAMRVHIRRSREKLKKDAETGEAAAGPKPEHLRNDSTPSVRLRTRDR